MRIDLPKLDNALDRALEAAIDHSIWPEILNQVAEATGAFGVNIVPVKGRFPGGLISTDSLKPAIEGYFDGGWDKNEWRARGFPLLAARGTVLEQHYTTREDFKVQDYYRAQSRFGLGRTCIVGFSSGDELLCFVLHRKLSDDPFDSDHESIFRLMRDRLMVSASMMRNLSAQNVEGMVEAFDIADVGAIFFDRFGKVTRVNAKAQTSLGRHLKVVQCELRSDKSGETASIRKRMISVLTERWLRPSDDGPVLIERFGERPLLLRIQRLGSGLLDIFSHSVGVCIVEDMNPRSVSDTLLLARALRLTPAEASLAILLSKGITLRSAAERKGVSYETVRTQLRSIFDKTGVRRQSELVALIGTMATVRL
ncbi:MAG: helix-turn-helix transcriptional regulator [Ensifer adhaerens]